MSAQDVSTPRLFLIRHGETSWSRSGHYTGITDLPLLPDGEDRVRGTARVIYGVGKLIDPSKLSRVYLSPRQRAGRTWEILQETAGEKGFEGEVLRTESVAEWGYGDYEGMLTHEIRELRKSRGLDGETEWDIWRDGTEGKGGEGPDCVCKRLDGVIGDITTLQGKGMKERKSCDVIVVAHGHILRAFVKRWLGLPLETELNLMLEPGGVCGLSYSHGKIEERAVLVGMSFPTPVG